MASKRGFLILIDDIEKFLETQEFPGAENLTMKAREAIDKDYEAKFERVFGFRKTSILKIVQ